MYVTLDYNKNQNHRMSIKIMSRKSKFNKIMAFLVTGFTLFLGDMILSIKDK